MRGAASANYYLNLAQDDYYISATESPGYWLGKGARQLALGGRVQRDLFKNLLEGMSPDGSRPLVQNAREEDRQSAWDLTFSAPKGVSVLWALGPAEIRDEIERIHQRSVGVATAYLEENAGLTRRGKGGAIQERAALTFAVFQHGSSRALDPQIHSHCVLLNIGVRADGTTGALKTNEVFRHKIRAGSLYRKQLEIELKRSFGVTIQRQKVGFRVVGVPERLCRVFSKRRRAVEKKMQDQGRSGAIQAKLVTLETRPAKVQVPREELLRQWQEVGKSAGWSMEQVEALLHGRSGKSHTELSDDGFVQTATKAETETRSIPRERQEDARKQAAATNEPRDPEPNAAHSDTQPLSHHPAKAKAPAALPPEQPSPAAPSSSAQEVAAAIEPEPNQTSPHGRMSAEAGHPTPKSIARSIAETSPQPGSAQQLLPGVRQPDGLRQGIGTPPAALAPQNIPFSVPSPILPVDQPRNGVSTNPKAIVATPELKNSPASQPPPGSQLPRRSEAPPPQGASRVPATEVTQGPTPTPHGQNGALLARPDNSRREVSHEPPALLQSPQPFDFSRNQPSSTTRPPAEQPFENPDMAPLTSKATTPASRARNAQNTVQPDNAASQMINGQAPGQEPRNGVPSLGQVSNPATPEPQGQTSNHQKTQARPEITPDLGSDAKGSPTRDQNASPTGCGRESWPTPSENAASPDEPEREQPDTAASKQAAPQRDQRSNDPNHQATDDKSRPGRERENQKQSQRDDRQQNTQGQSEKRASSQKQQDKTAKGPNQQPNPAPTGLGIAWYPAFPKAPSWSLASRIMVPGIVYPPPQPRWGHVRWKKKFLFLRFAVQDRILFPDAPNWSLFRGLKLRAYRFSIAKEALPGPPQPRWWSITWKKDLPVGELRVQQRNLFLHAPKWSPFHGVSHKALHLTPRKSRWTKEAHEYWRSHLH